MDRYSCAYTQAHHRISAWNHPLGHLPALASLSGHLVYGLVLGLVEIVFINIL